MSRTKNVSIKMEDKVVKYTQGSRNNKINLNFSNIKDMYKLCLNLSHDVMHDFNLSSMSGRIYKNILAIRNVVPSKLWNKTIVSYSTIVKSKINNNSLSLITKFISSDDDEDDEDDMAGGSDELENDTLYYQIQDTIIDYMTNNNYLNEINNDEPYNQNELYASIMNIGTIILSYLGSTRKEEFNDYDYDISVNTINQNMTNIDIYNEFMSTLNNITTDYENFFSDVGPLLNNIENADNIKTGGSCNVNIQSKMTDELACTIINIDIALNNDDCFIEYNEKLTENNVKGIIILYYFQKNHQFLVNLFSILQPTEEINNLFQNGKLLLEQFNINPFLELNAYIDEFNNNIINLDDDKINQIRCVLDICIEHYKLIKTIISSYCVYDMLVEYAYHIEKYIETKNKENILQLIVDNNFCSEFSAKLFIKFIINNKLLDSDSDFLIPQPQNIFEEQDVTENNNILEQLPKPISIMDDEVDNNNNMYIEEPEPEPPAPFRWP